MKSVRRFLKKTWLIVNVVVFGSSFRSKNGSCLIFLCVVRVSVPTQSFMIYPQVRIETHHYSWEKVITITFGIYLDLGRVIIFVPHGRVQSCLRFTFWTLTLSRTVITPLKRKRLVWSQSPSVNFSSKFILSLRVFYCKFYRSKVILQFVVLYYSFSSMFLLYFIRQLSTVVPILSV